MDDYIGSYFKVRRKKHPIGPHNSVKGCGASQKTPYTMQVYINE